MPGQPVKLFASRAERYPEPDGADIVQGGARTLLAAIPLIGGSITEALSMVLAPAVVRRRDEWFRELADALDRLEQKVEGFKVEEIANNEPFISAVIQATRAATATHRPEKRAMLRNALLNSALGRGPAEELQEFFFASLDALSLNHIRILKFYWKGIAELSEAGKWNPVSLTYALTNYAGAIGELYPDLRGQEDYLLCLMTDLKSRGFSTISRPADSFPQGPAITNAGIQFLRFILDPTG
jgi:hypothetical protein